MDHPRRQRARNEFAGAMAENGGEMDAAGEAEEDLFDRSGGDAGDAASGDDRPTRERRRGKKGKKKGRDEPDQEQDEDNEDLFADGGPGPSSSADEVPWEHDKQPPLGAPVRVQYCPDCGMPPDFCDWGGMWDKCKIRAAEQYPQYYPELAEKMASLTLEEKEQVEAAAAASVANTELKLLAKKNKGKEVEQKVTVQRQNRKGRKFITTVKGLETFGVKLDKASKVFSKAFSCGAAVVKGAPGQPDEIDIQGDVEDGLEEVILRTFPEVDDDKIYYLKPK
ncbi:unnamed protein product [Vitrella brassicaformis CCMP3155]|uniref:SUI1 domain-containing protein n=1 Tax=Vitrella brassicaformis (strain CCMP3155) TaxID=1169540 RepID=A0A0G4EF52_VITBC|nr:unnamed protein product [Vitrella brassicaformis CCMP3155]|eukprot:CEL94144.1 unnamed protein product [Vitrella brassicaformis CCMP3155]